jgi:hypothetical protein
MNYPGSRENSKPRIYGLPPDAIVEVGAAHAVDDHVCFLVPALPGDSSPIFPAAVPSVAAGGAGCFGSPIRFAHSSELAATARPPGERSAA